VLPTTLRASRHRGGLVDLRELLSRVGRTYDRALGQSSEAQLLLRGAKTSLADLVPENMLVEGSGGKGNAAIVPWISVFDLRETDTATRGMYLVYLFDADMKTVSLSLNQGITELKQRFGGPGCPGLSQARAVREAMDPATIAGLDHTIDLRSNAELPRAYEAGVMVAKTYDLAQLPTELRADLARFIDIYGYALEVRDSLRLSTPDLIATTREVERPTPDGEFKPGNADDYVAEIPARTMHKRRDHEKVLTSYVRAVTANGFTCNNTTVYPRDLTLDRDGQHWLAEVKVVYRHNGVNATREALAQLLMYRAFYYSRPEAVQLIAVFSESIGDLCAGFLADLGIVAIWKDGPDWIGSPAAVAAGLATRSGG
jgi:hypothetical protein